MIRSIWRFPFSAIVLVGAASLAGAGPAAANDSDSSRAVGRPAVLVFDPLVFNIISDEELAQMRGKFVRPDNVSFFGITLLTSWQDAQGVTTNARLVFNIDFLGMDNDGPAEPVLMVGWQREGDPAMDVTQSHSGYVPYVTANQVLPVGSFETHQGAAQANIIAGADNFARNGMQIAIVPASAIPSFEMAGLQTVDGSRELSFTDGDQLYFVAEDNRLGISMTGGSGLDSSLQSLGGDVGQMLQQTLLITDGNSLLNNATIVMGTDDFGQRDIVRVENALSVMRGNGF